MRRTLRTILPAGVLLAAGLCACSGAGNPAVSARASAVAAEKVTLRGECSQLAVAAGKITDATAGLGPTRLAAAVGDDATGWTTQLQLAEAGQSHGTAAAVSADIARAINDITYAQGDVAGDEGVLFPASWAHATDDLNAGHAACTGQPAPAPAATGGVPALPKPPPVTPAAPVTSPPAPHIQTPSAAPTPAPAPQDTVTFIVTGTAGANVTYGPAGSDFQGSVPMSITQPLGSPAYYDINAQLQGYGSVACEIEVDGQVIAQGAAEGGYNIADCEISQDPLTGDWQSDN